MKAEIIAVGTEILTGQIVNTNAQFLSEKLAEIGVDVYFQTAVGDNGSRLLSLLELASNRSNLVILTGVWVRRKMTDQTNCGQIFGPRFGF